MRRNRIYTGQWFVAVLALAIGLSSYGCKDTVSVSEDVQVPLASLAVTPGTLQPAFFSNTTNYTVDVSTTVTSVTVTAVPKDSTTTMTINTATINPGQSRSVPLSPSGTTTDITIVLTNQNGIESTYDIVVRKVANTLSALSVNPGPLVPTFAPGTLSYQVDVGSSVTSVTVVATKADPHAVMSGSVTAGPGVATGKATIQLNGPGTDTLVSITVAVPNGEAKTYTVTVHRALSDNINLSALTVTPGPLVPVFAAATLNYTVDVPTDVTEVTVIATKSDPNAVLSGSVLDPGTGVPTGQATITLNGAGTPTSISITVTAQNTIDSKIYTVTVNRAASGNNNLSALTVTPGTLVPDFAPSTTTYSADVANAVTSVTITATLQDTNASMLINGQGTSSGQARDIGLGAPGPTSIEIIVTAPNEISKTYTITVNRAAPASDANLSALSVSPGSLNPPFDPNISAYTVEGATAVISVTVTATKSDQNATMSALGSVIAPPGTTTGTVLVLLGTTVEITVIAQDAVTSKTYTITFNLAVPPSP